MGRGYSKERDKRYKAERQRQSRIEKEDRRSRSEAKKNRKYPKTGDTW